MTTTPLIKRPPLILHRVPYPDIAPFMPLGTCLNPCKIKYGFDLLLIPNSLAHVSAFADSKNPMNKASKKFLKYYRN